MKTTLLLLILFLSATLQAQDKLVDSLTIELSRAKTDSARVMLNCSLSKHYALTDANKAITYGQAAIELATASGFTPGQARALNLLGNAHLIMGQYDMAMDDYYKALKVSSQHSDTSGVITSYLNLGSVYHKTKDPARATKHYLLASELAQKAGDSLRLGKAYNNLGNVYEEKAAYGQALSLYTRAARVQEGLGDKKGLAVSLLNIGNMHSSLGQPEKGLPYLFRSVRLNEETQNDMIMIASLGKVAGAYLAMGHEEEAQKYARQSFDMAVKTESSKKIAEASQLMQTIYASMEDYAKAYKYLSIFMEHDEILSAESRARIASEVTVKYETEQKELENQLLKAEKERQAAEIKNQQYILALGAAVIFLMLVVLVLLYVSRQRLEAACTGLQEAQGMMETQQTEIITQKNELSSQAVALREQNEQLEKHGSFKNRVFTIVSHDLKSPLASLKGVLNLVQERSMSEGDVKRIFGLLDKEMDVAMGMLDNILVWAKAQLQESSVEMQAIDLHLLAEENIQLARPHADKKDVILVNSIAENAAVLADRERLNFVLRNLLMNAVKFSYPGGEVRLEAIEQEGLITLAVSDGGKGISAAHVPKLFAETRFTTTGTSGEKGTGLGLLLCQELVESFGACIGVESEEGKGSRFSVALPKVKIRRVEEVKRQAFAELV